VYYSNKEDLLVNKKEGVNTVLPRFFERLTEQKIPKTRDWSIG
jgi:hypothetical protein